MARLQLVYMANLPYVYVCTAAHCLLTIWRLTTTLVVVPHR
jgi:hypothetical protein